MNGPTRRPTLTLLVLVAVWVLVIIWGLVTNEAAAIGGGALMLVLALGGLYAARKSASG